MNPIDFLSGQFDYIFERLIGKQFKGSTSKYTAVRPKIGWQEYDNIATSDENIATFINLWQTLGTKYDFKVKCELFGSEKKNDKLKNDIENIIKNNHNLHWFLLFQLAVKGNVVLTTNEDDELIGQYADFYDTYYDWINNRFLKFDFKIDGVVKIKDLQQGEELYWIRNPFNYTDIGTPPIDLIYTKILTNSNLWQFINQQASDGLTGLNVPLLENTVGSVPIDWEEKDSESGKSRLTRITETFKNWWSKTRENKKDRLGVFPYLKGFAKLTSSIKDEQVLEILDELKAVYSKAYNLSPQVLGDGKTTYNNIEALIDNEWARVGKVLQELIANIYNEWILPKYYGIETGEKLRVYVEKPQDEDQAEKERSIISLIGTASDILSTEEKRRIIKDTFGFDLADNFEPDELPEEEEPEEEEPEEEKPEPEQEEEPAKFEVKKKDRNILEEAFKSSYYERSERVKGKIEKKGLKPLLEKSIRLQLERTITNFKENESFDLKKHFVKIESVLPFRVLKDNLENFVDIARQEVADRIKELGKKSKFSSKFALSDVLDTYLNALVKFNLQGYDSLSKEERDLLGDFDGKYKGFDEETINQINTVLQEFKDSPFDEIVTALTVLIEKLPKARAELISQMLVVNAVERSRYLEYKDKGFKFKRHLGVRDNRETTYSIEASRLGVVDIDYVFNHQIGDGQAPPLHFRERSSMIYGIEKSDIS